MSQIANVVKYESDNSTFIWKHPLEDFNSLTQLIVHESQEAIFFMNGQALDLFGAGRYTLETQNIPKIGKLLNRTTGDQTSFHCEVYFINKTEQMAIKWGTDSKVQYVEPVYGFPIAIGACGEMSLRAQDSRKLLLKLVGTENVLSQARLVDYFRAFLMTRVKTYIAQTMKAKAINIFEIDENLSSFSDEIKELLIPDFEDYGVALDKFFVTSVLKPDGEPQYEKFKELHFRQYADVAEVTLQQRVSLIQAQTEAQKTIIASQAMATKRAQEGYSYQQERGFDVLGDAARNEGSGSDLMNFGTGFGMTRPVGNLMNSIASNSMNGLMDPIGAPANTMSGVPQEEENPISSMTNLKSEASQQDNSNSNVNNGNDNMADFERRLDKLIMMRNKGLITEEEFTGRKNQLLNEI